MPLAGVKSERMENLSRPIAWLIGGLVVFSLLLCGVVVVGGLYVSAQLEAQQREIESLRATPGNGPPASSWSRPRWTCTGGWTSWSTTPGC